MADSNNSKAARPPNGFSISRQLSANPIWAIVLMFALTQLLAVPAGILLLQAAASNPQVQQLSAAPTGNADDLLNALFFVGYILFGAVAIVLTLRYYKGRMLFRLLEFSVVIGSVSMLLFAYLNGLAGMPFEQALGLSSLLGFVFGVAKFFWPVPLKNSAAILSSAGVGALFGFSMGFWPALMFVLALSLYDYIAVFRTKHMLQMAQALGTKSLSFTITAEAGGPDESHEKKQAAHAASVSTSRPAVVPSAPPAVLSEPGASSHPSASAAASHSTHSARPIERLDLGSGDLAVPAMLAISSYTVAGPAGAIAVMIGTTISIFLLLGLVVEKRVALPALPPICLGGLLALLVVKLAGF